MKMVRPVKTKRRFYQPRHTIIGVAKHKERQQAIDLRMQGLSYSEILKRVPVAKSSLSLWLHSVGLSKTQHQRITEKKLAGMKRGWETRRRQRVERMKDIHVEALREAKRFLKDPLFVLGTALYWAEGTKQKEWNKSQLISFSNMDPRMHDVFLLWVEKYFHQNRNDLIYQLYIHPSADISHAAKHWKTSLKITPQRFSVYMKPPNTRSPRHNQGAQYHGLMRILIPQSTDLNRRVSGWTDGVLQFLRIT